MSEWPTVVAGLGGTALGATATGSFAWLMEKSRRQHELHTHWLDARRDLAVRFLDAAEDVVELALQLTNLMRADEGGPRVVMVGGPQTTGEAMELLHGADVRVRALNTEIDLVGSEGERQAAKDLREAAWLTFSGSRVVGPDARPPEDVQAANADALRAYQEARSRFRETVREGLVSAASADAR